MATTFDITGRINAAVSSGSLRMLKKLQTELRATAKALMQMGDKATANALGHTALAMDKVAAGMGKVTENSKKVVDSSTKTTKAMAKAAGIAKTSQGIYEKVAEGYKLNAVEAGALYKAVGKLGQKYGYTAKMQKEWVPALKESLAGIYKQKAALVASGKAITAHVSSTELFDRVNRKLALGADKVKSSFTDYGRAMENSLGRSTAFRTETTKLAKSFGAQGEAFKKQFSALTKADDLWRKHVTTLHRSGEITTKVAKQMYSASEHLNMPLEKLRANIKATVPQVGLFSRAMSSLVVHLKSFASYAAAASIISGIAGVFGLATRAIIQYDQALHDLQAITRATDEQVVLMGEKIREIGRTTKFSASEVAVAMRTLGQSGFTASEAISSIGAVANLATGTLTSMTAVVDLVTTAIRAFDLSATETTRVSDVFANAVNRSKLTIDKLRIAFNYIGPIAAKTGISLEETATTTMMLANAGIRASTIGTGLRRTFQQLIDPTKELQAAIEEAGYTTEDFNPQMNDMRDVIRRLTEIVPDAESAFRMFSLRSSAAVAALSSQGVASFDALHSSLLRSGTAAEMAEKQIEGLGIIFKQAWDKAQDLALALGEVGVASALRVLGKSLQVAFDGMRIFISSGIGKAIIAVAGLTAGLYGIVKVWGLLKFAAWGQSVLFFANQLLFARTACEALDVVSSKLNMTFIYLAAAVAVAYGAYKIYSTVLGEVSKVSTKYIDDLNEIHKEELKRLESIKRLVSIVRDELETNRGRLKALADLSEKGVELNLVLREEASETENLTENILGNKDALDKWAQAFGDYSEKVKIENLKAQVDLFGKTEEVIRKAASSMSYWSKMSKKFTSETAQGLAKLPILGGLVSGAFLLMRKRVDACREANKALESQQGEAYERMVTAVSSFGEVTQEVWKKYMLNAGASEEAVAKLFIDNKEKITRAHLEAYIKIQLAREDMTKTEKAELEKHLKLVGDLFGRIYSTTALELEKGLKSIREHYSEREKVVTEFYDSDVLYLKEKLDFEEGAYDKLLGLVRRQLNTRLSLLNQSYEEEKALIKSKNLGIVKEQEKLIEQDKKRANRRLKIEQEMVDAISAIHGLQIDSIKRQHEAEIAITEKAFEKQKESVNDYYSWKATKVKQDILVDEKAFDDRIAAEEKYYAQKVDRSDQEIEAQKVLQETLLDIEREKYLEILAVEEEHFKNQLVHEESYVSESRKLIEEKLASNAELYKDDAENRKKIEKELNDELLGIIRESRGRQEAIVSKSYESRIASLTAWRGELRESYSSAKDFAQSYADKVKEIEIEITNLRKSEAEKLAGIIETTEDRIITARRAGMSEAMIVIDKMAEARRKTAEADRLVAEGTTESLEKAKALYMEAQGIWAGLATQANAAAKEGKDIGVSYDTAMGQVVTSGENAQGAVRDYTALLVAQKEAEKSAAEDSKQHWETVATAIETTLTKVATAIDKLTAALNTLQGIEITPTINTQSLDEAGRKSGETKQALEDIGNAHVAPTVETADLDRAAESGRVLHTSLDDIPGHVAISVDGRELKITSDAAGKLDIDLEGVALPRIVALDSTELGEAQEDGEKLKEVLDGVTAEDRQVKLDSSEVIEAARNAEELALAQESANEVLEGTGEAASEAGDATGDYSEELNEAKDKTEELSEAGEEGEEVTHRQIVAAGNHSKELGKKAKELKGVADTEKDGLVVAEKALKVAKEKLVTAREELAQLLKSGTATAEQINKAKENVLQQENLVGAAKKNVAEQKKVAAAAVQAAAAFGKEAEAARKLASDLNNATMTASKYMNVLKPQKRTAAIWTRHHKEMDEATDRTNEVLQEFGITLENTDKSMANLGEATEKLGEKWARSMQEVHEHNLADEGIPTIEKLNSALYEAGESVIYLTDVFQRMDLSFTESEDSMARVSEALASSFEELIKSGDRAGESLVQLIEEAVRIEEATIKMEEFSTEVDTAYDEAAVAARDFGGATRGAADEIMNMVREAEKARDSVEYLGEEELEDLQDAIDASRDKLVELTEEAQKASDKLASIGEKLRDQLDKQLGNLTAIEERRYAAQIAEIERLYEAAGESAEAHAAYLEALALAEELHREKMSDLVEKQNKKDLEAEETRHKKKMANLDEYLEKLKETGAQSGPFIPPPKVGFAAGGEVPGSGFLDTVHAMLTPGEFVLTKGVVKQLGLPFLNTLIRFKASIPKFATGGFVGNVLARLSSLDTLNNFKSPVPAFARGGLVEPDSSTSVANAPSVQTRDINLYVNITGAGEITEKQVRRWIIPSIQKIRRLES